MKQRGLQKPVRGVPLPGKQGDAVRGGRAWHFGGARHLRLLASSFRGPLSLLITLLFAPIGLAQGLFLDSRVQVRDAVIAVYPDSALEPAAMIRAGRVFSDYQTRGFFRIGALPLVVLDKLSIELLAPERLSRTLSHLGEKFTVRNDARKAVEGRDFRLWFASRKDAQLRARRVRLESGTTWRLLDGIFQPPGSAAIPFRQATLSVTGPNAGELAYETARGTARIHLLSLLSESTTKDSAL
jgi:hypothetical protein